MNNLRTLIGRQPAPVIFLVMAVLFGGLTWLTHLGLGDSIGRGGFGVANAAIQGVAFASVMTIVLVRQRRRFGGADRMAEYTAVFRGGRVAPGTDTSGWPSRLAEMERNARRLRVVGIILFGLFAGLTVYLITADPPNRPWAVAGLVFFVSAGVFYALYPSWVKRKADAVRTQLIGGSDLRSDDSSA